MVLRVYNTLTKQKDEFKPINGKKISLFVCGITPYDFPHIGHGKTYTQFDIIVRYLRWLDYNVFYLMNVTDIDDKIIKRANESGTTWKDIARKYEESFHEDMRELNNDSVTEFARATDYMDAIIKQVKDLLEKGFAYETDDGIYFEISKFKDYGKLSKQDLDQIKAGARVEVSEKKKDHSDFVLWKKFKPGEPFWESPWSKGRPGWHIEDTAITETYFGPQYDLHGGAVDLIFPHHECEIAQMEAASGKKPLVKYWIHTAFLNIAKDKMSKSLGNMINIRDAIAQFGAEALRYYYVVNHYRTPLDYEDENLEQAKNSLETLNNFIQDLYAVSSAEENKEVEHLIEKLLVKFEEHMNNDFDAPGAIAALFDFMHSINKLDFGKKDAAKVLKTLEEVDSVFKVLDFGKVEIPKEILSLVAKREEVRKAKDFKESDRLRDEIKAKGYVVEDTSSGARVKKV